MNDIRDALFREIQTKTFRAVLTTERSGVISGVEEAAECAARLGVQWTCSLEEGAALEAGETVAEIAASPKQMALAAVGKMGARKLSELYYRTMLKLVITDLGPYKPKRVGHPTMLALCGKHFPEFNEERALMEEFVAAAKEYGFALELNTAGLESPEDCEEIYGQALLPYMKKYDVPVSLGADAHRPERIGSDFDHPVILEAMKYLRPVWGDGTLRAARATGTARYEEAANDCIG